MKSDLKIFTIGHSTNSIEYFFDLIEKNGIDTVVDVRSIPYSRFANQFNKENLVKFFKSKKIYYLSMGDSLGARVENQEFLSDDGSVDFLKVMKSREFLKGISRVEEGVKKGYKIVLMCSERDPLKCHRFSLISRFLSQKGYEIFHIVGSEVIHHSKLEEKLIQYYKKNHKISLEISKIMNFKETQLSMFEDMVNKENLYTQINKSIAYSYTSTNEEMI